MTVDINLYNNSIISGGAGEILSLNKIKGNMICESSKICRLKIPGKNQIIKLFFRTNISVNYIFKGTSIIRFRNDYKLFASGNWDSKIRIYSKKAKLLAVLE